MWKEQANILEQGAGDLEAGLVRGKHAEGNGKVKVGKEVSCSAVTDGTVRQSVLVPVEGKMKEPGDDS